MENIHSNFTVSISELKKNPTALINEADGSPIAILNHNKPTAYLVPADTYEKIIEVLDDIELGKIATKRLKTMKKSVAVSLDDL
jgi:antitoxin StbD